MTPSSGPGLAPADPRGLKRKRRKRSVETPLPGPPLPHPLPLDQPVDQPREPAVKRERRPVGGVEHQALRSDGVVRDLRYVQGVRMSGSRSEARRQVSGFDRRTRADRVDAVLWNLAVYRAVSRRAIVASCFDGHAFAANPVLAQLQRDGFVHTAKVKSGRYGYQVLGLTDRGLDWLRDRRDDRVVSGRAAPPDRKKNHPWDAWADDQRLWPTRQLDRQLRHDHQVFEAVLQDAEPELEAGGRIRRVRLDAELRGLLASADSTARATGGRKAAADARRTEAARLGLTVFKQGAPIPDALVEIERPDGEVVVRAIEVATGSYSTAQIADKVRAGFRVYRVPNSKAGGKRRGAMRLDPDMQLISWGPAR